MKAAYPTFRDIAFSIYQIPGKAPNLESDREQERDRAAEKVQATEKALHLGCMTQ